MQNVELTCVGDVYNFIQIFLTKTNSVYILESGVCTTGYEKNPFYEIMELFGLFTLICQIDTFLNQNIYDVCIPARVQCIK